MITKDTIVTTSAKKENWGNSVNSPIQITYIRQHKSQTVCTEIPDIISLVSSAYYHSKNLMPLWFHLLLIELHKTSPHFWGNYKSPSATIIEWKKNMQRNTTVVNDKDEYKYKLWKSIGTPEIAGVNMPSPITMEVPTRTSPKRSLCRTWLPSSFFCR